MQKRTEAEWLALISDYENSGLSQPSWCRARGINVYTFRDRKSRLMKANLTNQAENKKEDSAEMIQCMENTIELSSWEDKYKQSEARVAELEALVKFYEEQNTVVS